MEEEGAPETEKHEEKPESPKEEPKKVEAPDEPKPSIAQRIRAGIRALRVYWNECKEC